MEMTSPAELADARNRVPTWVMPLIRIFVIVCDAVLAGLCLIAAFKLRQHEAILSATALAWSREFVPYAGILYFIIPVRVAMLMYERVYRFYGEFSYADQAIRIFRAVFVSSLLTVAWTFLFRGGFSFREFSYSRGVFLLEFAISLLFFLVFHLGLRWLQVLVRNRGVNLIPTLVVGTGGEAIRTIEELRGRKYLGYRVLGVVEPSLDTGSDFDAAPLLGRLDDLAELIRKYQIQEVIITDPSLQGEKLFDTMMAVGRRRRVEFRFAPGLFDLLPQKTSVEQLGVLPMVRLFREPLSDVQRFVKRLSDLIISAIGIVVTFPIWAVAAIAVRADSRGPILFRQERVGMDGRVFLCYKFRTMKADADESVHRDAYKKNIAGSADANAGNITAPVYGKVKDDLRVTRVGRSLRRTSIDELPQLLNVLKGEMSIVGPRPPIPYEVEEYEKWHRKRLDMKPGITGLWQVSGRNRLTFDEMVRADLFYIENWSLLLDLKMIFLTLPAIFRGDSEK